MRERHTLLHLHSTVSFIIDFIIPSFALLYNFRTTSFSVQKASQCLCHYGPASDFVRWYISPKAPEPIWQPTLGPLLLFNPKRVNCLVTSSPQLQNAGRAIHLRHIVLHKWITAFQLFAQNLRISLMYPCKDRTLQFRIISKTFLNHHIHVIVGGMST